MFFFTNHFVSALRSSQIIMDSAQVRVVLFRYAPSLEFLQDRWLSASTVAELVAYPGWQEVTATGYPLSTYITTSTRTMSGSKYVMFSEYPFSSLAGPVEAEAIGLVYIGTLAPVTNPLIFVTTTPTGGLTSIYPGDSLTSNPDPVFPDQTNRWLFAWAVSRPDPIEGPLEFFRAPPVFEVSGSQHVWLYPQRANMIANPSFEAPGMNYWGGNGALAQVAGGAPAAGKVIKGELADEASLPPTGVAGDNWLIDDEVWTWSTTEEEWVNIGELPGASAWSGQVTGVGGLCVMESNVFPTRLGNRDSEQWTVQVMVKGTEGAQCKVGLVSWDPDYRVTMVDWGEDDDLNTETWTLHDNAWTHIATHRTGPQAHTAMVRIESQGTTMTIDSVLAERGYLKDWLYFDGDNKYGARDDFCWYGGYNRRGKSYSLWYNNRKAVTGRLFAQAVDPNDPTANVTDEDMEAQGLVYRWVPAGITVKAWMDVFYPHDLKLPVPTRTATVLPYYDAATAPDGVLNPWV